MHRLSPPTVRIQAYGDQEVKVIGSIVLYMYTSEKTDRVIWQVTDTTGVPILGRVQAKLMHYISVAQKYMHPNSSLQSLKIVFSLQTTYTVWRPHTTVYKDCTVYG